MVKNNLEARCRKAVIKISRTVEKIRQQLYRLDDVNDKLSHIIKNLGEEYYYGKRFKGIYNNRDNYKIRKN